MSRNHIAPKLLVGLGNPGKDYQNTRHNAGVWWLNQVARALGVHLHLEKQFFGEVAKATPPQGDDLWLLYPATFMNRSGQAVGALARFYKIAPAEILVAHDELDLMPGTAKLKQAGGHAGHNGLRDIIASLNSPDFWRLRIGIGHPRTLQLQQDVANFVLHRPSLDEQIAIENSIDASLKVLPLLLKGDWMQATKALHTAAP